MYELTIYHDYGQMNSQRRTRLFSTAESTCMTVRKCSCETHMHDSSAWQFGSSATGGDILSTVGSLAPYKAASIKSMEPSVDKKIPAK